MSLATGYAMNKRRKRMAEGGDSDNEVYFEENHRGEFLPKKRKAPQENEALPDNVTSIRAKGEREYYAKRKAEDERMEHVKKDDREWEEGERKKALERKRREQLKLVPKPKEAQGGMVDRIMKRRSHR